LRLSLLDCAGIARTKKTPSLTIELLRIACAMARFITVKFVAGCDSQSASVRYSSKKNPKQEGPTLTSMGQEQLSVADLYRRAQAIRREDPSRSYKQIKEQLLRELQGKPFPPLYNLTFPEQDDRAPEEDWSAGLALVRRGIQFQDWSEIVDGIILSLEQTENYERERGPEGTRDKWHDRSQGIEEAESKAVGKWMPEELMKLAERQMKK
jgi:hypothetical protein